MHRAVCRPGGSEAFAHNFVSTSGCSTVSFVELSSFGERRCLGRIFGCDVADEHVAGEQQHVICLNIFDKRLFCTVSRGSRVPWGGFSGPRRVSSQMVQRVREGWRRLEKVGEGQRRLEKVREGWRRLVDS